MTAFAKVGTLALIGLLVTGAAQAQTTCVGDCNGDGMVSVSELVLGVNISLGTAELSRCEAFDCQNNNMVPVSCLIQGVNNSLLGCGPHNTPTVTPIRPTPTSTPSVSGQTRTFTIGNNTTFDVGGCCGATCDNQIAGVEACIDSDQCSGGQECAPGQEVSRTGIFNGSPLGNTNAVQTFASDPLVLELGPPDSTGIAQLRLKNDVRIDADIFGGAGCFCLRLLAAGGSGTIDCDGGTPYDTATFQPSGQENGWTAETGLGEPAGPGDGNLIVMGQIKFVGNVTCEAADCANQEFNPPVPFPFTTTNAIAYKGTCPGSSCVQLTNRGEAFDCANFSTPNSGGALAAGGEISLLGLETANTIRMSE